MCYRIGKSVTAVSLVLLLVVGLSGLCVGCAQNTESPQEQKAVQTTPTKTDQDTATQGGNTYMVNIYNGTGSATSQPSIRPSVLNLEGKSASDLAAATVKGSNSTGAGNGTAEAAAGYIVAGTTITFTTGDQTPTVSGTTTGSGTQTPTAGQTSYPTQRVDPSVSAQLGAALPGGAVTQQSTPVTGAGTASGQAQTTTNDLKTQLNDLKAKDEALQTMFGSLIEAWNKMFPDAPVASAASQPAT